ncbi:MAG TPA: ATP-binding protein [Blastocatellia bacterium]|nr:ATP-binding protein [Blastocatellia bacterium]
MIDSVRIKLTIWHVGVLAVVLTVFSFVVYALLSKTLHNRLDAALSGSLEAAAASLTHEIDEGETPSQAAHSTVQDLFIPQQALAIFDLEGRLLAERHARDQSQARLPELSQIPRDHPLLLTMPNSNSPHGSPIRIATRQFKIAANGPAYLVAIGQSFVTLNEELEALRQVLSVAVPLALLLAGLGGWFLARQSLAPVAAMAESARSMSAENLNDRLPVANPRDELGQLALTFNDLLTRLNAASSQQRQFMTDASHELRTPLHVVRTAAAVTLEREHREEEEYRDALTIIEQQATRLTQMVEEMFTLARADAGRRPIEQHDFYLDELVTQATRAATILAARKSITIQLSPMTEAAYRGDENLLRQMLLNILHNAIEYTPEGGRIELQLERQDNIYLITVTDTGIGIPEEAQPHIFERFYRADKARARARLNGHGSGAGLGLSIAQWVIETHGGSIKLERSDQFGSKFVIRLPSTPKLETI